MKKGNKGHSTRYKFKSLPMGVYLTQNSQTKKVFRVCKKINGKTKTFKYTKCLKEVTELAKKIMEKK